MLKQAQKYKIISGQNQILAILVHHPHPHPTGDPPLEEGVQTPLILLWQRDRQGQGGGHGVCFQSRPQLSLP